MFLAFGVFGFGVFGFVGVFSFFVFIFQKNACIVVWCRVHHNHIPEYTALARSMRFVS